MIYSEFQGKKLSALGFGAMRLPKHEDGTIDEQAVAEALIILTRPIFITVVNRNL